MKSYRWMLVIPCLLALGLVTVALAAAQRGGSIAPSAGGPPVSAGSDRPASNGAMSAAQTAGYSQEHAAGKQVPVSNSAMMPGFLEGYGQRSSVVLQGAPVKTDAHGRMVLSQGFPGSSGQVPQAGGTILLSPAGPTTIGDWDSRGIYAPAVITDSGMLKMWYTGFDLKNTARIGYAESIDGIQWTRSAANPVLDLGAPGAWDDIEIGQPSVIKNGSLYQMWYFGASKNGVKQIGYATSSNGLSWTKYASNPVLTVGNPGDWDETEVGGPRVVFDGTNYHLWYHGYRGSCCDSIGYATSPDGANWTKHPGNPVFGPGEPGQWDETFIDFTSVLSNTGQFHMWYCVGGQSGGIGYVTSTDGITWTRFLTGPVLTSGAPGEWDENFIFAPAVIHEGGLYRMWYTGHDANWTGRFGYATSTDGITWTKSTSNPVFTPGSMGLVISANYAHDWVIAHSNPNISITVTVAGKDWITGMTDGGGEFRSWDWNWGNNKPPDILPGDSIFAVAPGANTEINPVGTIQGVLDLENDTIAGTINAPFGTLTLTVRCELWAGDKPSIELTGIPADGGSYTCDFGAAGWDIKYGQQVAVMYYEPDGDQVINVFESPWMRVNYAHDWAGGNYPPGHTFWITVTNSTGDVKGTNEIVSASGQGWGGDGFQTGGGWSPQQQDIQDGDWVYFTSDDGYSNLIQTGVITGLVNTDNDSVDGNVYAGWFTQTLNIECDPWGGPPNTPSKFSTAGPNGDPPYLCQWDPNTEWDIQPGQDIAVMYIEPDGDRVINVFRQLTLNIRTNYTHDWVEGNFESGHTMWITLTDSTGAIKATATGVTGPIEWWGGQTGFSTNANVPWRGSQPDIHAGDWVYACMDNGMIAESHLGMIDTIVDVNADTVHGTISAPWYTDTLHVDCGIWENGGPGIGVDGVDPNGGSYSCDFSGQWDILPGTTIGVSYNEPDGDQVINVAYNPAPHLRINTWANGQLATGSNYQFYIQYHNNGDAPTENATISAVLDGGLTYLGDTSGLPVSGAGTPSDPLVWQLGTLPPNNNHDVQFFLFTHVTAATGDWITNTVQIENGVPYEQNNPEEKISQWSQQVTDNETELVIGKGTWTWDPVPGSQFVYDINVCNKGRTDSAAVILTDTLPLSTTLVSWWGQAPGWTEVSSSAHELVVSRISFQGWTFNDVYVRVELDANAWTGMTLHNVATIYSSNDIHPEDNWTEIWHNVGYPHSNLQVNLNWNWGELVPGGEIRYGIDYHNDGNVPAQNVRITETLPASTTFRSAVWYDDTGGYPFTPTLVTDKYVVWEIGTLDNGYGFNFEVALGVDPQATPGQELVNTVCITRLENEDRYDDNTRSWTEVLYNHGPNLRVRKTGDWQGWGDGHNAWYDITVENVGDMPVEHVTVTDTLPISMALDGDPNTDWKEVENYTRNDAEGWFSFTFTYLHPNWRRDINLNVYNPSPDPVPAGEFFTNRVNIMQVEGEPNYADNSSEYTLYTGPDLYVQKRLVSGDVLPGQVVTFSLLWGNSQSGQAWWWGLQGTAWLTDTLPAGTEFITATQRWCGDQSWCHVGPQVEGDTLGWHLWQINPGTWNEFYVTVRLPESLTGMDMVVNQAVIAGDQPLVDLEPDYANNTAVYQTDVLLPFFEVAKTYNSSALAGMPVTYTVTVTNNGHSDGSELVVGDKLPDYLTYLSGGSYYTGTGEVTWTIPILTSGEGAQVAFTGQLTCQAGLQVVNDAYRVISSVEGVASDWGAPVAFTVISPTITVSFEASSLSVLTGETVSFTGAAATDGTALTYAWDFGGDGTATGVSASHAFTDPGSYTITLTVTDGCGYMADYSLTVEVVSSTMNVYLPVVMK